MDARMQQIEDIEREIKFIKDGYDLIKAENNGTLSLQQVTRRDDLIADRLQEIDELDRQIKLEKVEKV